MLAKTGSVFSVGIADSTKPADVVLSANPPIAGTRSFVAAAATRFTVKWRCGFRCPWTCKDQSRREPVIPLLDSIFKTEFVANCTCPGKTGVGQSWARIRTGSDWANFCCLNGIVITISKVFVVIRFYRFHNLGNAKRAVPVLPLETKAQL